jgi:hypothetical protein
LIAYLRQKRIPYAEIRRMTLWQVNEIEGHELDDKGNLSWQYEGEGPNDNEHTLYVKSQMAKGLTRREAETLWAEGNERKRFVFQLEREYRERHDATLAVYELELERQPMPSNERRKLISKRRDEIWDGGAKEFNEKVAAFRRGQLMRREPGRLL